MSVLGRLNGGHDFVNLVNYPEAKIIPGVLILRPEMALFFGNAERTMALARQYAAASDARVVVMSLEESPDLDSSSIEALADLCAALYLQKKHLMLARLKFASRVVLERAAIPHLHIGSFSELSVDDVVTMAREVYVEKS